MHCTSCNTLQCYVCSATVKDYNHFDQGGHRGRTSGAGSSKKCPLYDNVEERHEREVKEAEAKARAEIVESNPDVSAEDLEIKVSDAVKKAEDERLQRGRQGFGAGMVGYDYMPHRMYMLNPPGRRLGGAGEGELDDMLDLLGPHHNAAGEARQEQAGGAEGAENRLQRLREEHEDVENRLQRLRQARDRRRELQRQVRLQRAAGRIGGAGMPVGHEGLPGLAAAPGAQPLDNPFDGAAHFADFLPYLGNPQQQRGPPAQQIYPQPANPPAQQPLPGGAFGPMAGYAGLPNVAGMFGAAPAALQARMAQQRRMQFQQQRQRQLLQQRQAASATPQNGGLPAQNNNNTNNPAHHHALGNDAHNNPRDDVVARANAEIARVHARAMTAPYPIYPDPGLAPPAQIHRPPPPRARGPGDQEMEQFRARGDWYPRMR